MDNVRKIVNCTPEQYYALCKDGQVEVDGVIRYKEKGTLYNPGELTLLEWYNKVMNAEYDKHFIAHTPFVMKSLKQFYDDIVNNPDIPEITEFTSAVGFSVNLKKGDKIPVKTSDKWGFTLGGDNTGTCFINGIKVENTYICNSDNEEAVKVWYFDVGLTLGLNITYVPTYYPYECYIFEKETSVTFVDNAYYKSASIVNLYGRDVNDNLYGSSIVKVKGTNNITQKAYDCVEYYHEGTEFPQNSNIFEGNKNVVKIDLPNLRTIKMCDIQSNTFFRGCTNQNLVINFPELRIIEDSFADRSQFLNVYKVILQNKVTHVGRQVFKGNSIIELKCNSYTTRFDSNWISTTPNVSFTMCKNWQASINISVAAKNWSVEKMKDFFINYLADLFKIEYPEGDSTIIGEELTIPLATLTALEENGESEEGGCIAIAEGKGWTIGGA